MASDFAIVIDESALSRVYTWLLSLEDQTDQESDFASAMRQAAASDEAQ